MTFRIHRQFIAAVAALSMAITGFSAAPARAGDDDLAKALAVILGVAIVGSAIKNKNDDRKGRAEVHRKKPQAYHKQRTHTRRDHVKPRPLPRHVSRKLLPQRCLYNLRNDRGRQIQAFGQHCLNRHYGHVRTLPRECGQRVWTNRGAGYGYGARCLRQHGYQLARR